MRKSTRSPRITGTVYGGEAEGDLFVTNLDNGAVRIGFKGIGPFFDATSPAFTTAAYAAAFAKSQTEIDAIAGKAMESLNPANAA
jgi:hypothetical protein